MAVVLKGWHFYPLLAPAQKDLCVCPSRAIKQQIFIVSCHILISTPPEDINEVRGMPAANAQRRKNIAKDLTEEMHGRSSVLLNGGRWLLKAKFKIIGLENCSQWGVLLLQDDNDRCRMTQKKDFSSV